MNGLKDIDKDHDKKYNVTRRDGKGFCLFTMFQIEKGLKLLFHLKFISHEVLQSVNFVQIYLFCTNLL